MKYSTIAAVFAILCVASNLAAQTAGVNALPSSSPNALSVSEISPYAVSERGAHYQVWSKVTTQTSAAGETLYTTNFFIERASGMNYWNGQQWTPSNPSFQVSPDGSTAMASQVQNKVSLAANLNTNGGAVTVNTADGLTLNSTPVGIALYDAASGNFATIAWITNCAGYLVNSNKIVYSNAFAGLCADVVYTSECGAFHQDVMINGHLDPAEYGFPTNTTRIQILTEYYQPPMPQAVSRLLQVQTNQTLRASMASPDLVDSTLGFGEFVLGPGRAYTAASGDPTFGGVPVGKQFITITNQGSTRTFLIESVAYPSIKKELDLLPECNGQTGRIEVEKKPFEYAVLPAAHPTAKTAAIFTQTPARMASLEKPTGVVIDYVGMSGDMYTPVTFQCDTTYFISGPLYCNNSVTFEGGTVIKYPSTNTTAYIELFGSATFSGSSYLPVFFVPADDNSVGETLTTSAWSGYTGTISGYYANPALWFDFDFSGTASNLRFRNAQQAVRLDAENAGFETVTLNHSQFVNCYQAIEVGSGSSMTLNAFNDLFTAVPFPFDSDPSISHFIPYNLAQCTIDGMTSYDYGIYTNGPTHSYSFSSWNSIFADTSDPNGFYSVGGTNNGFYHFSFNGGSNFGTSPVSTTTVPFQTAGAGEYYLANNCVFHNAGTTNIDASLLAQLKQKTTYPPLLYTNVTAYMNTTLLPVAQRDVGSPDVGYNYDPIDYLVDLFVVTNATLTVTNGAVIASDNSSAGIWLEDGSTMVSIGTPLTPNWFTRYYAVQEQAVALGSAAPSSAVGINPNHFGSTGPNGTFQFTKFACPAGGGNHLYHTSTTSFYSSLLVEECELWGGQSTVNGPLTNNVTATFMNNLFYRSGISAVRTGNAPDVLSLTNNLIFGGLITLREPTNSTWYAFNNAFDSGTIGTTLVTNGNNAFLNCSTQLSPTNTNNIVLTNTMAYQPGPLGIFYQPTNSALIDKGNTNANVLGLFHYTTQTSQVTETNSLVDIGYHYVAVDGNGKPLDADGDGIPDYLEDANGNGVVDGTETSPTVYNSPNNLSSAPGLVVLTPLK